MNLSVVKKQFALFFLIPAFIISACTKIVTTDVGGDLIPPIDGVTTKEMYLDIVSRNIKDTATRVGTSDIQALGYVTDPLFGQTAASINVQLKPAFPLIYPVSPDSLFIDSVVLVLSYKGAWGDTSKNLALRVFEIPFGELKGNLKPGTDSAYRTDYIIPSDGNLELTQNNVAKSINIRALNDTNHIRIRLNDSYGTRLLDTLPGYKTDSTFDSIFINKGYQIIPQTTGNALMKISLTDTATKLAIYYHHRDRDTIGKMDTTIQYFSCTSYNCGSTNYVKRSRTGQVAAHLPSPGVNDDLIFIDANPGIYARLQINGLDTISNRIIHRAEILMEQVPDLTSGNDTFLTAPNLFLSAYSQDSGRRFAIPNDVQFSGLYVANQFGFGCFPLRKTDPSSGKSIYAYSFDISRYLQGIVTRHEKSYDLILYAPFNDYIYPTETAAVQVFTGSSSSPLNYPAMGRVRLGGGSNTTHKMKLHIVYSEVLK